MPSLRPKLEILKHESPKSGAMSLAHSHLQNVHDKILANSSQIDQYDLQELMLCLTQFVQFGTKRTLWYAGGLKHVVNVLNDSYIYQHSDEDAHHHEQDVKAWDEMRDFLKKVADICYSKDPLLAGYLLSVEAGETRLTEAF